jgi:hypothetical protein
VNFLAGFPGYAFTGFGGQEEGPAMPSNPTANAQFCLAVTGGHVQVIDAQG